MISTGIDTRIKTQQIIDNQLPEFILSESPEAVKFLKKYYLSQEYTGAPVDLVDNLDQYLKLDNLTPEVIAGKTKTTGITTIGATTINVSSTKGFPATYGLFKIDDEIITYKEKTATQFIDCERGFSGITTYRDINNPSELLFSSTIASEHAIDTSVQNLSVLFLQEFYKKLKKTFTPGLENVNFVENLDVNNFIKESRTFYESKGTEESFRILFNVLYGVDPKIIDLENYLIKPSSATYVRRKRIVAEQLLGDPLKLKGQTIFRTTDESSSASISEVEILTGISGISTTTSYFILDVFVGFDDAEFITGTFEVTGKTKVIDDIQKNSKVITVDSTIGFPTSGKIISGINTNIQYTDKTINQFLNCTGIDNSINLGDDILADDKIFGYENGDLTKRVELRITGVIDKFIPNENNKLSIEGETITVKSIGELIKNPTRNKSQKQIFANSWNYNTSSKYNLVSQIDGEQSTFNVSSFIDKSSLKVGDELQVLERKTSQFSLPTVVTISNGKSTFKVEAISENQKEVTIDEKVEFDRTKKYAIRRVLKKVVNDVDPITLNSIGAPIEFGENTLTSNIQNVYNESDKHLYVASNSLPSHPISKDLSKSVISTVIENDTIQGKNPATNKYSIISFDSKTPFITGDKVYYEPESLSLVGLESGFYYVKTFDNGQKTNNKIKLFKSPAFIDSDRFLEFGVPAITNTKHTFILANQYNKKISPQKLLKKYSIDIDQNLGTKIEVTPGSVGMLIDGVEIQSIKSTDSIFYGPIEEFTVASSGSGYDIINPPLLTIETNSTNSTEALASPVISGDIREIQVDPQDFDIEDIVSIQLTGGNSGEAVLQPILRRRNRILEFSGVTTFFGGGIDTNSETLTFFNPHNIVSGQILVYDKNSNSELGIGTFKGSNQGTETLVDGQQYWPEVVGLSTVLLYRSEADYISGINTIGFTNVSKKGIHKFRLKDAKNTLSSIRVIKSGKPYLSKKVFVDPNIGISTFKSTITFKNHGFLNGENISYEPSVGLGVNNPQSIVGLSTSIEYKILKVDDDTFRLANAGVGGTDKTNFISKNYVELKSKGTGYQLFKYPDIKITTNVIYSVPTSEKINLTPIIQGKIIDVSLYENGTGYGSTDIINYHNKPNVLIKNGTTRPNKNITPALNPIISDGKILSVNIQDGGAEYHSTPDLIVIGDGTGASLRAIIDRDETSNTHLKIIDVIILNAGTGYSFDKTRVNVVTRGLNCLFNTRIRELAINNIQLKNSKYNKKYSREILVDPADNGLQYSVVGYSTQIGQDEYGQEFDENGDPKHSPIVGWAYDGNPIYGPFGYDDSFNNSSTVRFLKSGYTLNSTIENRNDLPFELGFFVDDYTFTPSSLTDLDEHNGRFCKTPDYPKGVYAYFATFDSINKEPEFPYFIGKTFRSIPETLDKTKTLTQSFDFNNSELIRNTFPYNLSDVDRGNDFIIESNEIIPQITKVTSVSQGFINSLLILKSGQDYKINDAVVLDDTGTGGSGASAFVSEIKGKEITEIDTTFEALENVTFIRKDSDTLSIFVSDTHDLDVGDNLEISGLTTDIKSLSGIPLIGNHNISFVPSETTILYKELPSNSNTGVISDIFVYKTSVISVGSSIGIGTEKLIVLNKFDDKNILRVERGITGTAHSLSTKVDLIPKFFDIPFRTNAFDSKIDNVAYFNPRQSVGIATTVGISSSISVTVGDITTEVSVPAQSIYLPNHPFKTGQQVTLKTDGNSAIEVSRDGSVGEAFTLPFSGSTQNLFVINKSPNYIGIVTQVDLISSTNGLFFRSNGDDYYKYRFESNFNKVVGNVERINSTVSLSTSHNLSIGDIISLQINSDRSVGIGTSTSVKVKYNDLTDSLLINEIGFTSAVVNTEKNQITLDSHGLITGDKVYYDADDEVISGLDTGGYFVYKLDSNNIKLAKTFYNSKIIPPDIISIGSTGGSQQKLSLINPPIPVIRDNNLVFDVSDSSLNGFDFKIYRDDKFNNDFVSTGKTTTNTVSRSGIIGVTPTATVTINYSINNPLNLFYNVEKSGFISTSDIDVKNASKISYIDSEYNKDYPIISTPSDTQFNIRLKRKPELLLYNKSNTDVLKYNTTSKTDIGPINKINLAFGGFGYKTSPKFVTVTSAQGINAKLLPDSATTNKIENTDILNVGFEYPSDKTLTPIANLSPVITTVNSNKITSIVVDNGGKNFISPPTLVLQDNESKEIVESGSFQANINQSQSISSVDILSTPQGIGDCTLFTKNNTNGIPITNITIGSTIVTDTTSGIVTVTLATPVLGFSTAPFEVGDTLFVEGVSNEYGDTFNSPVNKFSFYPVTNIIGGNNPNPFKMEFNINELVSNPGFAKTLQNFASVINFKNYPRFKLITELPEFLTGEQILVSREDGSLPKGFNSVGLTLDKVTNNYIKVLGNFELQKNDKLKGSFSGVIANINTISFNEGKFSVSFGANRNIGWSNDIGKLNQDYQVIADNDYYQTLSYTIQSPIEYQELVSPVNNLLHTTGLKNFADVGISSAVGVGSTVSVDTSTIIRDLTSENRVDAIDNLDLVRDIDVINNPTTSKFVSFNQLKLSNFFECRTNRVILIDNINPLFKNSSNNARIDGSLNILSAFNRFLIQARVSSVSPSLGSTTNTVQATELVTFTDFANENIYTVQKGILDDESPIVDIVGDKNNEGVFRLLFTPTNPNDVDLQIKILQQTFLSGSSSGNLQVGFVTLTNSSQNTLPSTVSTVVSSSILNTESFFTTVEVTDSITNDNNIIEIYTTHDGTDSFISNYSLETNTGVSIGTFTSEIDSNILKLNYNNDTSNEVFIKSKTVGFGTTAAGIGTYRFKTSSQPDGSENSARLESNFVSIASTDIISGFTSTRDLTIKSIIKVSVGETSALHQTLMTHDDENTFLTHYPFISIGNDVGMGTFSSEYNGNNLNLKFHPDSEFIGVDLQVQSYHEIINTDIDLLNVSPPLQYGNIVETLSLLEFDSLNGLSKNRLSFPLKHNGSLIFAKYFDPSTSVNLSTGEFNIENNFFNRNERLIYEPGSSIDGVGISSLVMSNGNPLPSEVYVVNPEETVNSQIFKLSLTRGGSAITFNSVGSGNRHKLEMFKKNEKSLITLDDVLQSPISYTPITNNLFDNVNSQVSISTSIISLTGIGTIVSSDILKINDEFVKVNNVGLGTTNVGPITNTGTLNLIDVTRSMLGSSATTHNDGEIVRLYKGSYNIVEENIFFTEAPRGTSIISKNDSNRDFGRSNFGGRAYLRQDYSTNVVFDDISTEFTGLGKTFTTLVSGANTTGITTGSSFLTLNGIFQAPTTLKNPDNNYEFSESVGVTSFIFSGITSTDGTPITSEFDVNLNQLPRSGQIVSIGFSGGLGIAPLAGASVTAVLDSNGAITAVGVGATDQNGSGYRPELSDTGNGIIAIGVTDSTGNGAQVTASVGVGGTLIYSVQQGGSGYTNPTIISPSPNYENLPIEGISRLGIGPTTETGTGLLLNIEVGGSNTTGIGSTLFEVKSFATTRTGYGFRKGDKFKPVGLITDKSLSSPLEDIEFTVEEIFTDSFCSWNVGEFDYIDSIRQLQDGIRKRFPLNFNGELVSFQKQSGVDIDMNALLLIIINGVVQNPGESYFFNGGTSFEFTEAPDPNDNVLVFFYIGTDNVDVIFNDARESIKIGDQIRIMRPNGLVGPDQDRRTVTGIKTSDVLETNVYTDQNGIQENVLKPLRWLKQKRDKFINGELVLKTRPSIEPLVFPEARVIQDFSTSDPVTLYIDNTGIGTNSLVDFFFYENPNEIGVTVFDESITPKVADLTAVVSSGQVQEILINDGGEGYVGPSTTLSIASPRSKTGVDLTQKDLLILNRQVTDFATATANVSAAGTIQSITIVNAGAGYTEAPQVIAPTPTIPSELITNFTSSDGFTGIVTAIEVQGGNSTIKFFLEKESGTFSGLTNGDPFFIYDTAVGSGATSVIISTGAPVGIGTSFFDNVYIISSLQTSSNTASFIAGVATDNTLSGISTSGISGKFSWGKLVGGRRTSTNPISVTVSGKTINAGLTTFPRIQRRNSGIRNTGAVSDKDTLI